VTVKAYSDRREERRAANDPVRGVRGVRRVYKHHTARGVAAPLRLCICKYVN